MSAHALLSASSSERWLNCTASVRFEEQFPDTTSEYAKEGTLAHAIAELKATHRFTQNLTDRQLKLRLNKLKADALYHEEMERHTDAYVDYISEVVHSFTSQPYIGLEQKLDYSKYAPEGFGTGDCVVIGGSHLHVIDFKYGKGVEVSARKNSQMMCYALGAIEMYSLFYNIEQITMTVFQPRLNNIDSYMLPKRSLIEWGETVLRPRAIMAYEGNGTFVSGNHCRFCRGKAVCRQRAEDNLKLEGFTAAKPAQLTFEEIGGLIARAKQMSKWAKDLEEYALSEVLKGNEIPGWKVVEGRSVRKIEDIDSAFKYLQEHDIEDALLYRRQPLNITELESLLGKKQFDELLKDFVIKPTGKPTLAEITDKREPMKLNSTAAEDFKEEIS